MKAAIAMPQPPSPEVEAIVAARHADPFGFLGMHKASAGLYVRAFLPDAESVSVIDSASGQVAAQAERIHPAGLFVASMARRRSPFRYRLSASRGGELHEFEDIYRFAPVLGELDVHLFVEGNHLASYQKLGAHPIVHDGVEGVAFAVWAPNAKRVSLVGDFNGWDGRRMPMRRLHAGGFWEIFIPGLKPGHLYKYELLGPDGALLPLKADPHAAQAERPPGTASVVTASSRFAWQDEAWMAERWRHNDREAPISTYEVHLGSWRRILEEGGRYLSYRELAEQLVPYVADRLHPYRSDAGDRVSVRRIMGIPAGFAVRADLALWHARRFPGVYRYLSQCRDRAAARLGARPFPERCAWARRFDGTALYEHADPRQGCTATGTR
jgi:1,4-alpha-glucan branching enzyme